MRTLGHTVIEYCTHRLRPQISLHDNPVELAGSMQSLAAPFYKSAEIGLRSKILQYPEPSG